MFIALRLSEILGYIRGSATESDQEAVHMQRELAMGVLFRLK